MYTIALFLFIFLSTLIVPSNRKFAALIASSISMTWAIFSLGLFLKANTSYYAVNLRFSITYAGIITGILSGFYVSYEFFKNRNWSTPKKNEEEDKEVY
jgi:hypothetical protein